jgi:hypothetical protein
MNLEICRKIFEKSSNMEFHEYLPSGRRTVRCRQTERQTSTTKLKVSFCNSANASTKTLLVVQLQYYQHSLHRKAAMSRLTITHQTLQRPKRTACQVVRKFPNVYTAFTTASYISRCESVLLLIVWVANTA